MKGKVLTFERVTKVDIVSKRVAQLDTYKFAVPGSLYVLPPVALGV